MAKDDEFYCTKRVAKRYYMSESFLEKLRCYGGGPPYYKIGGAVRYKYSDIELWLEKQRHDPADQSKDAKGVAA